MDLREKPSQWYQMSEFILRLRWVWILFFTIFFFLKISERLEQLFSTLEEVRMQHHWILHFVLLNEDGRWNNLIEVLESGLYWLLPLPILFLGQTILRHRWLLWGLPFVFLLQWQLLTLGPENGMKALVAFGGYAGLCLLLFLFTRFSWAGALPVVMLLIVVWWIHQQNIFQNFGFMTLTKGFWVQELMSTFVFLGMIRFTKDFAYEMRIGKPKLAALVHAVHNHLPIFTIVWSVMAIGGFGFFVFGLKLPFYTGMAFIMLCLYQFFFTNVLLPAILSLLPFRGKKIS